MEARRKAHDQQQQAVENSGDAERGDDDPQRTQRQIGGDLAGLTVDGGIGQLVLLAVAHKPDGIERLFVALDGERQGGAVLYHGQILVRHFFLRVGVVDDLFKRFFLQLTPCQHGVFGVVDVACLRIKSAEVARIEGHLLAGFVGSELLADVVVKGERRVVCIALYRLAYLAADAVGFCRLGSEYSARVMVLGFDMEFAVEHGAIAPIGHIDAAEALDQIGLAIFARDKRMAFDLPDIRFLALFLGDRKRNDMLTFPVGADLVKQHGRAAAVGTKADGVLLVIGHQLRAAGGADIGIALKVALRLGVVVGIVV